MKRPTISRMQWLTAIASALALLEAIFLFRQEEALRAEREMALRFPEQLVFARSQDGIVNGGALFAPGKASAKSIAILWIHGWGVNFYYPTYVKIGRALAERGYACITGNTRMHDIGTIAGERDGKRIRGGGYWGVPSEQTQDIAAWIDFATSHGFRKVVLVGHSAGCAAVRRYQAETQDERVIGLVLASGMVKPGADPPPSEKQSSSDMLAQAKRLVADGRGDDLLRFPTQHRPYPSFVSAATYLDDANTPREFGDFFGVRTSTPAVTRVRCPILAWFGTSGDVGNVADLELLKSSTKRQTSGPSRVETLMIQNADHMYTGEEEQVAQTLARWIDTLAPLKSSKGP